MNLEVRNKLLKSKKAQISEWNSGDNSGYENQ